jgi:hypothetical protein
VVAAAGTRATIAQALGAAHVEELSATRLTAEALTRTWQGVGRYATQFAWPVLVAASILPRHRLRRAVTLAALALAAPIAELSRRPDVTPSHLVAGRIADDLAYGAGVYAGCVKQRTVAPLKVAFQRRGSEK